jgi:hypothetical protein
MVEELIRGSFDHFKDGMNSDSPHWLPLLNQKGASRGTSFLGINQIP